MKRIAILLCCIFILSCSACGAKMEEVQSAAFEGQVQAEENQYTEDVNHTEDANDVEEKSEAESIQDEIAKVEAQSCEYDNADWGSMGQQQMNQLTTAR